MKLLEYNGKELLKNYDITLQRGVVNIKIILSKGNDNGS
jgi:succinyl-CoA synthetase beta subunit